MIKNAYIVSLMALSVALFAIGLLYLFLNVFDNPKLEAYRKAAKAMAFTYFFFGVVNIMEILEQFSSEISDHALLFRMVTLVIASAQAFFFMFAMVSLINTQYMTPKRTNREFSFVVAFTVVGILSYLFLNEKVASIFAYVYTAFYFSQLIRYTLRFRKLYRHCLHEMENWFSENEEDRLSWVYYSFHFALAIGLVAFVFAIFPFAIFGLITSLACLVFYVFFAIHFVNYVFVFYIMEDVITEEPDEVVPATFESKSVAIMKRQINKWIADRRYCQAGVTIRDFADHLGTNTTYLSRYINKYEGKTFRNWIGALRIKEAQRLIQSHPSCKIDTIAESVGYTNKSTFCSQFTKLTDMTPGEWRRQI